jgi:hypothetical protein
MLAIKYGKPVIGIYGAMYGIFTYIWVILRVNVGIHIPAPWSIWDI